MFGLAGLTPDMVMVFALIGCTMTLVVADVIRVDVVACLIIVFLGLTKLLPSDQLFSGFSSDAVISLIAIMIIGAGLERSGLMARIANKLVKMGGESEVRINIMLMFTSGLISGIMRSVGAVALMMPVVTRIGRRTGISKSKFLMPLTFCAILGSTITMVGSGPLILLNSLLMSNGGLIDKQGKGIEPFGIFAVLPIGMSLLVVGVLYFLIMEKKLMRQVPRRVPTHRDTLNYFQKIYGIGGELFEIRIPTSSSIAGTTLKEFEALLNPSVVVIGVRQGADIEIPPLRRLELKAGTVIAVIGQKELIEPFVLLYGLRLSQFISAFSEALHPTNAGLCEAVIPPSSTLIGHDLHSMHMRRQLGVQLLAVLRGTTIFRGAELRDLTLRPGDSLGMFCRWKSLQNFEKDPDFVVITSDYPKEEPSTGKISAAIFFFVSCMLMILFGHVNLPVGLLVGAVGMIFSGVLSIDDAYAAISWKTVFLLAGLIPLGKAIEVTGASEWVIERSLPHLMHHSVWVLQLMLAVLSTCFSLVLSNVGATVLLVPLAIELAIKIGASPALFALIVAVCASNGFILQTHQANALISGPGHYSAKDFLRVGMPLTVLYWVVSLVCINFYY